MLEASLEPLLGPEVEALRTAMGMPPPTSIRLNPLKPALDSGEQVPWCAQGRYLKERPVFTLDPLFHAGAFYVQEASSMFLEQAITHSGLGDRDVLALDLCAAPGGKSTHLRSMLSAGSLVVANEVEGRRRSALEENLWKWGQSGVVISGSRTSDLERIPELFDLILVDAPCSGEGMFRKDPHARDQWDPVLVAQCAATQRSMLQHAWTALRPGGVLIQSTCTWEPLENEHQVRDLIALGAEVMDIPLDRGWGIERTEIGGGSGYRFYPHRLRGEGFFLSMIRKPGVLVARGDRTTEQLGYEEVRDQIRSGGSLWFTERQGILYGTDIKWQSTIEQLMRELRVTAPGIPIMERKAGSWRPHASLALNELLQESRYPILDLDHSEALTYLRGHSLPAQDAHGTALARYQRLPLGWLQGAGSRWNNRWPSPWRIRMHDR